jgi:hypothetical protein
MIAYLCEIQLPTTRRFANCKISIYADDHMPAHFHIEGRGFRAIVEIETMVVRAGDVRRSREALTWAGMNIELLRSGWLRLNRRR